MTYGISGKRISVIRNGKEKPVNPASSPLAWSQTEDQLQLSKTKNYFFLKRPFKSNLKGLFLPFYQTKNLLC